jgi:hypothetical protein
MMDKCGFKLDNGTVCAIDKMEDSALRRIMDACQDVMDYRVIERVIYNIDNREKTIETFRINKIEAKLARMKEAQLRSAGKSKICEISTDSSEDAEPVAVVKPKRKYHKKADESDSDYSENEATLYHEYKKSTVAISKSSVRSANRSNNLHQQTLPLLIPSGVEEVTDDMLAMTTYKAQS